jgi:hypothetical protein
MENVSSFSNPTVETSPEKETSLTDKVKETASSLTDKARDVAGQVADKAREVVGNVNMGDLGRKADDAAVAAGHGLAVLPVGPVRGHPGLVGVDLVAPRLLHRVELVRPEQPARDRRTGRAGA